MDRRKNREKRDELERILREARNYTPSKRMELNSRSDYIKVAEILFREDHRGLMVVRDGEGKTWVLEARPDVMEEGVIRSCDQVEVGSEILVKFRQLFHIWWETVAYTFEKPQSR